MGKKNRMGKGLDMLFADNTPHETEQEQTGEQGNNVAMVRLSLLEPNKDQPRDLFEEQGLEELADSIRENGVIQPLLVRPIGNGGYQIVAGERRWRAARMAGLTQVPVFIKELDQVQTMKMALIENIQRQDLTPMEEARAYKSLMESCSLTQEEAARAVGKSRSAIANSVRLLSLCDEAAQLLDKGSISVGHAKVLAGLEQEDQLRYAQLCTDDGLTVRELEKAIKTQLEADEGEDPEKELLKKSSVKRARPFLKEFEVSVNAASSIKVRTKDEKDGSVSVRLNIGSEQDIEAVLSKLGALLENY